MAALTPQYIEMLLFNAAAGSYLAQWELFDKMLGTWPVLASCVQELTYGIQRKKLIFEPYAEEDEQPSPSAVEKSKLVCEALYNMQPDPASDENDFEQTIRDLISAWFVGVSVCEIVWIRNETGVVPQLTQWAHPKYLAFNDAAQVGLLSNVQGKSQWVQFPDNKFLIGIHKSKSSSPASAALLRPLAWYWCANNFSNDWLLNLAQLFGIPWRVGYYDPTATDQTKRDIDTMLQNMGSASWGRFPRSQAGDKAFELIQPKNASANDSPQAHMADRADRYARDLILGQTMSGGAGTTGKGGGQAFGTVEADVKQDRIDAAGKFVANIINQQLIKYILMLNYGDATEAPKMRFLNDEEGDLAEAQRDKVLVDMGVPFGVKFARKKYGIPEPAEGEELLEQPKPQSQFGSPAGSDFGQQNISDESGDDEPTKAMRAILAIEDDAEFMSALKAAASQFSILPSEENARRLERNAASSQTGHPFYGNQYVRLGDRVTTPHGEGTVVGSDYHSAFVSVKGTIRQYKRSDLKKVQPKVKP